MKPSLKSKRSLYIPEKFLKEMLEEAKRQDRSLSWIVQQSWKIARTDIMRLPAINEIINDESFKQHIKS